MRIGSTSCYLARDGQMLRSHIYETAEIAYSFAAPFGLGEVARAIGLLHDLGKYSEAFQRYLSNSLLGKKVTRGEVPHAWLGAFEALNELENERSLVGLADIIANIVASHHGGLSDMISDSERMMPNRVNKYAERKCEQINDILEEKEVEGILSEIKWEYVIKEFNNLRMNLGTKDKFALHLAVKFLYSCLIDADRSNAAMIKALEISSNWDKIEECIDNKLSKFAEMPEELKSPLDNIRANISNQCAKQADRPIGVFSLSVPTGGGKTLSSLRFAIRHARKNGLKRIIYVIPYLSIIDQTVSDFRDIFGSNAEKWILEHHSNFLLETDNEDAEKSYDLATERWNAPIVVTTMVQFLESAFSNKATDLRKFHNMMQSIFIFDEVQALPVKCTYMFNDLLNFLHKFGGTSSVLCTATQPALAKVDRPINLSDSPDLVSLSAEDKKLFNRTIFINKTNQEMTYEEIATLAKEQFNQGKSTLVVVNTKKEAREVFKSLGECKDKYFLSTDMCPAHRLDVINLMHKILDSNERRRDHHIICVSTQLIEAGVDISFDCVIRAVAGFDSIVQVAGRCNRHGKSHIPQEVIIVRIADERLGNLPEIELGKRITDRLIREGVIDNVELALGRYYKYKFDMTEQKELMSYPTSGTYLHNVLGVNKIARESYKNAHNGSQYEGLHSAFQFAAEHFSVIEGYHIGVVVPYKHNEDEYMVNKLVGDFKKTREELNYAQDNEKRIAVHKERSRILQKLQQYTISIYANQEEMIHQIAELVDDTFYFLAASHYDSITGLTPEQGFASA